MPSCHVFSPAPPAEWADVGQHRSHLGPSHPLLYPVWCGDVIFYSSSRKACGTPMDPEGCNLQSFLLLWLHVCVVICVVICSKGITELTQAVGRLVISWHLQVCMVDTFRLQENLSPCHPAIWFAPKGGRPPLIPASSVMGGLLHSLSCQ